MLAWLNSTCHRENIFTPGWKDQGVALRVGDLNGNHEAAIWASDFGVRGALPGGAPKVTAREATSGTRPKIASDNSAPRHAAPPHSTPSGDVASHRRGSGEVDLGLRSSSRSTLFFPDLSAVRADARTLTPPGFLGRIPPTRPAPPTLRRHESPIPRHVRHPRRERDRGRTRSRAGAHAPVRPRRGGAAHERAVSRSERVSRRGGCRRGRRVRVVCHVPKPSRKQPLSAPSS